MESEKGRSDLREADQLNPKFGGNFTVEFLYFDLLFLFKAH